MLDVDVCEKSIYYPSLMDISVNSSVFVVDSSVFVVRCFLHGDKSFMYCAKESTAHNQCNSSVLWSRTINMLRCT